jgi:Fe2+ transport system protein FeoA
MTISEATIGESVIITSLLNNENVLKLVEMGFYENKMLTITAKAVSCDPICVQLGNSKIMLRKNEADSVIVRRCEKIDFRS